MSLYSPDLPYLKKVRNGIYDQIMCDNCERKFSTWDDYAYRLLISDNTSFEYVAGGLAVNYGKYDFHLLSMFFVSVLWRASVSKHASFLKTNLGPYEEKFRQMIINDQLNSNVRIILQRYIDQDHLVIASPTMSRFNSIIHYQINFGMISAWIKFCPQISPFESFNICLREGADLCCITKNFNDDFSKFRDMFHRNSDLLNYLNGN